jgi:hypothetical protein
MDRSCIEVFYSPVNCMDSYARARDIQHREHGFKMFRHNTVSRAFALEVDRERQNASD